MSPASGVLAPPRIQRLPSESRGHVEHGWLDARHSFSFGSYYNPKAMGYSSLRVINEDRVAPGTGFAPHSHQDMEIITYILSGALRHRDSTGGSEVLRPGELQLMRAGSGITHSEMNASHSEPVHLLQIWIHPDRKGLPPGYQQQALPAERLRQGWTVVVAPPGQDAPFTIHQDARLLIGWPPAGAEWRLPLAPVRRHYLHVARGRVQVEGHRLEAGDALTLEGAEQLRLRAETEAEVLLFDLV
jgi:redox-sensitive bicupin YhaK (pirin superfamily)